MIDFISAKNGGLEFTTICDTKIFGATLEECAEIIAKQGLANCVMGSSTMDFASEEGFENGLSWIDADVRRIPENSTNIYKKRLMQL